MSDIRCRNCGEPYDADTIHEEVAERAYVGTETTYSAVAAEFKQKGCAAFSELYGASAGDECKARSRESLHGSLLGAAYDLGLTPDEAEAEVSDYLGALS
jgi:hypothetical protein